MSERVKKIVLYICLIALIPLILVATSLTNNSKKSETPSIYYESSEIIIDTNEESYKIDIIKNKKDIKLSFKSENSSVATIDNEGNITPLKVGTTNIIVTASNGDTITIKLIIKDPIDVESISFENSEYIVDKEDTISLKVNIVPVDATNQKIVWKSSDEKVATVDENGNVTGISVGKAIITAFSSNNKYTTCNITVKQPDAKEIKLSTSNLTIYVSETTRINYTLVPAIASNPVTWSIDNQDIAIISNGVITGKSAGETKVYAKTSNGVVAECKVTVKDLEITDLKLNDSSLTINAGTAITLSYSITPSNANKSNLVWTSSNKDVASVDSKGVVIANSAGTATITVKAPSGKTSSCTIKVIGVAPSSISVSTPTLSLFDEESSVISYNILPSDAANKNVTWESSNKNIAQVDNNGKVTAKSPGTATITVKTGNGKTAKIDVTVKSYKVALIGNSKTYVASLVSVFKNVALNGGYSTDITEITEGGATLEWLSWNKSALLNNSYDIAVLQEQTDYASLYYDSYVYGAKEVANILKQYNSNIRLYVRETWPLKTQTSGEFDLTGDCKRNAAAVASNIGATVIPDGTAWVNSRNNYSSIELYDSDGRHQNNNGAYLVAVCMYKKIFGGNPTNITYYGNIDQNTARQLQQIANSTC